MKESEKLHKVANSIPSRRFMFASRCLENSLTHKVKHTYVKLRSVLSMLQKISWCVKSSHKQHLFQQHDFPFNVYRSVANTTSKEQGLLMDQDRGKP